MNARERDAPGTGEALDCGICVIGAGPAGASVALRLAQLGHDVCVIERAPFPRHRIGESLPPSILPVLETLGLRAGVEAAGFLRPQGAIVHWAGGAGRRDYGPSAPSFQVDRGVFDALLLEAARKGGARVLQPARAHRPVRRAGGWDVPLRGHDRFRMLRAGFLIDAAGKHAGLMRRATRTAVPTAALYAYWRLPGGIGPETRVEAGPDAWYWGAPLPGGSFNAAVFVDTARCAGLSGEQRARLYHDLVARSDLLAPCLDSRLLRPVRTCDATSYMDAVPVSRDMLRVGEANFSIDPQSSQGVQSAMVSAVQASIVAHTLIHRPENAGLATAFYLDRQRESVQQHAQLAAGHYARQGDVDGSAFWRSRAQIAPDLRSAPGRDAAAGALPEAMPLALSCESRIGPAPVIAGDMIEADVALSHPNLNRPVLFLGGVRLAPLLDQLPRGRTAGQMQAQWARQLDPGMAAAILNWLWTHGILVPARAA
jgi:flavin-dependent dehydrogenase